MLEALGFLLLLAAFMRLAFSLKTCILAAFDEIAASYAVSFSASICAKLFFLRLDTVFKCEKRLRYLLPGFVDFRQESVGSG